MLSADLGVKGFKINAYHPQINSRAQKSIRAIVMRLRHYVGNGQHNWYAFVQPLSYT